MPEPPVATPDHAAVIHDVLTDGLPDNTDAYAQERYDAAHVALDAFLAERQQDKEELRRIAVMANELARDGLMPKGTAVKIRDVALAALGVRGDEAIQVLRGAALAVEEDATP